jgi:outer membrane protein OmpA-like peptidoglycan-associated protein
MDDDDSNFITADRYEVRYGGGKLYLTGTLPDIETADVIVQRAGAIVGPDNLIVDHTFDPSVVIEPDIEIPIVVEDVVYFETGSATIAPEFYPLIDLGVLLLQLNPQASITVLTYTDASGSAEANLELSRKRAQAIKDYLIFMGGNPDQLLLDPRGEEGAVEGVSAEIAAEERRAEFILNGFLNGLFDT